MGAMREMVRKILSIVWGERGLSCEEERLARDCRVGGDLRDCGIAGDATESAGIGV